VAIGAAIQAGVLAGDLKDVLLLDVTPLSLGVETMGGVMTVLIPRNSTVPIRKSETFSTAEDNQTAVDIKVYQGERPMAADNMLLGQFRLEGIPQAPRGTPQVEVIFDIDANGILNVTARDKASGKEQKVTITATTNLNKADVEKLVKDAQANAAADRRRRELAEARNQGDVVAYEAEKMLVQLGDRLPGNERSRVEAQLKALKDALAGEDTANLRQQTEAMQQMVHALSQQAGAAPSDSGSGGNGSTQPEPDSTVEGEFREV
jgi:molecular chaperone DnaK